MESKDFGLQRNVGSLLASLSANADPQRAHDCAKFLSQSASQVSATPVSYTHLRAHET